MTQDLGAMKQLLMKMVVGDAVCFLIAVGFAVAHFAYGVGWALWPFIGFLAAAFAVQLWFLRGVARMNKGG